MTKNVITLVTLLSMLATPSLAGSAYIQQLGANAAPRVFDYPLTISTSADLILSDVEHSVGALTSTFAQFDIPIGGLSLMSQSGEGNVASIAQEGQYNLGVVLQSGNYNMASIQQTGSNHHAMIYQNGNHNSAFIVQR